MKSKLKKLYYNVLKLKSRVLYGKPVLVLMYHRINDVAEEKLRELTVSVANFENQLRYYKDKFQVLKLNEDWTALKKTGLVITFDDGYADNILNALPLLEKYQIPATIFVTTLNVDTEKEFWWDRLILNYSNCEESFYLPNQEVKVSKSNIIYNSIEKQLKQIANEEKEKWFSEFEKINQLLFFAREEYRSLSVSEIKLLSQHPLISLGIHTHNHYPLGSLSYEEQKEELLLSLNKLEELDIKFVKYLALPHGSYNEQTLKIMEELELTGVLMANNYYSSNKNRESKKINRILLPDIKDKALIDYLNLYDFKYL